MVNLKEESVADFYAGKSVFITGGTGFLGKILIEKLLYSTAVNQIYLLIRNKKGRSATERVSLLLESELFARLRKEKPSVLKKVVPIIGDLTAPNLGLSEADEELIITKVSIVFHVAATIRFNERMRDALTANVEATRAVISLCHRLREVHALVHVSTAYSNTNEKVVEERIYPPPAPLSEVYDFVKRCGDDDEVIKKLLDGRPNTYTFTKALAESIVLREHGNLPTAIVRPSIVISALKEPLPGWIDNWNGPTGLLHASTQGLHFSMVGKGSNVADLIPVDYVTNLMIVVATRCKNTHGLKVYNSCSGVKNPITYDTLSKTFIAACVLRKWHNVPFPRIIFVRWQFVNALLKFVMVNIPFFLIDLYLSFFGKPKYMRIIKQVKKAESLMTFFTQHQWKFIDDNVTELIKTMSHQDRRVFYCNPEDIDWNSYLGDYCLGVFKYLLKTRV